MHVPETWAPQWVHLVNYRELSGWPDCVKKTEASHMLHADNPGYGLDIICRLLAKK